MSSLSSTSAIVVAVLVPSAATLICVCAVLVLVGILHRVRCSRRSTPRRQPPATVSNTRYCTGMSISPEGGSTENGTGIPSDSTLISIPLLPPPYNIVMGFSSGYPAVALGDEVPEDAPPSYEVTDLREETSSHVLINTIV